jgi:hypothetical protein
MTESLTLDELADLEPSDVTTAGPESVDDAHDVLELDELTNLDGIGPATFAKLAGKISDELVRTKRGAIEWGRDVMESRVASFRGLCLMFVRLCFNVDALMPDAKAAWFDSDQKHPQRDPLKIPRGYATFFKGGEHWHVCLSLGRGLCLTNDTGTPGTINVARLADIERAWGYELMGYVTELNGDAPVPRTRATRRRVSDRAWRIARLRRAIVTARRNHNPEAIRRLRRWIDAVR